MFNEYLHEGYYPFFTGNREDYYMNIENVVNFILEQKMPLLCGFCIYKEAESFAGCTCVVRAL